MENITKLKCVVCGEVFEVTEYSNDVKCPKCGRTFPYDRASKYYKTFEKINSQEKKVALGEMYLKVDSLITESDFYLENEDFENAEKKLLEALEITTVDYRVYMGLVKAKTKNFTDLKDKTHFEYLQKAIDNSTEEVKQSIKNQYSNYYQKRNLSQEQLKEITIEQNIQKKKHVEDHLKTGIPKHYGMRKTNKVFNILIPIFSVLFVTFVVLLLLFSDEIIQSIFSLCAFAFAISLGIIITTLIQNKRKMAQYDFVLDFYDFLENTSYDEKTNSAILKKLDEYAISYVNNDASINIERNFNELSTLLISFEEIDLQKFISKYPKLIIKTEE